MTHRILVLVVFLLISRCIDAAMLRVVSVEDGQTITVERNGVRVPITLAGITIADAVGARNLLEWALADAWVLLEEQPGGAHYVWRTPDGMFLNRELVLRGFARATIADVQPPARIHGTYLGTVDPAGSQRRMTSKERVKPDKPGKMPKLKTPRAKKKG